MPWMIRCRVVQTPAHPDYNRIAVQSGSALRWIGSIEADKLGQNGIFVADITGAAEWQQFRNEFARLSVVDINDADIVRDVNVDVNDDDVVNDGDVLKVEAFTPPPPTQ